MRRRMNRVPLVLALLLFPSSVAADQISVYEPSGGSLTDDCNLEITDISHTLNVVHQSTAGATGSSFRLVFDWGTGGGSLLAFYSPYADPPYNPFSGVDLDYGSCLTGDFFVAQVIITGQTNVECEAFLYVRPAIGNENVLATNCAGSPAAAVGGTLTINGNETCSCQSTVPTSNSTWGAIKAMFK